MRLLNHWKAASIGLALLAATIYAVLIIHEISLRTERGAERRARTDASRELVEEEAMFGAIWAHQHRPYDASWCPDYSPSFHKGCAEAVVGASMPNGEAQRNCPRRPAAPSAAPPGNAC